MYSDWFVLVGLAAAAVFIWLGILSFLAWKQGNFLKSLFPKSGERDIRKKFEELLKTVEDFNKNLSNLDGKVANLNIEGLQHIQKVELLRFNPYDDTGGNISFTVCLLDDKGSGVVITSLHARSGTRVFAKEVTLGKSSQYELSKEEELVIKKAMKQ